MPVSWDVATELLAGELRRVYGEHGAASVFAGSYGWASPGRFHHAQSQLHRFLNCLGGYTGAVESYSHAAGSVLLRRVIASSEIFHMAGTFWRTLAEQTDVFLMLRRHAAQEQQHDGRRRLPAPHARLPGAGGRARGRVRALQPLRDDLADFTNASWHAISPGADVPVMLALAHTLITENLHDRDFLARYCVGFEQLERYILGLDDGQPKTPEWAAPLAELDADDLRALARRLAGKRVFITTTWSLQRSEHGEQPPWMGVALAAMLGQIGLPGGGFGFGYGSAQRVGEAPLAPGVGLPGCAWGATRVKSFIPVARISDMLLQPGEPFDYDGTQYTYPDIKLVYWSGGNPFHHHQHLGKLRRAFWRASTPSSCTSRTGRPPRGRPTSCCPAR